MSIQCQVVSEKTRVDIQTCTQNAIAILEVDVSDITPTGLVSVMDRFIHQWQQGHQPVVCDVDDLSLAMGSLWGEQLVKQFGWYWAEVTFPEHPETPAIGVLSPDRSLAIYPFHFLQQCLKHAAPVTIRLAFEILLDGSRVPRIAADTFENVMDNVHHKPPRV